MSSYRTDANLLAHNTVLNFVGQIIPLIFGLIAIPITIKGLGIEAFGILSLVWVVLGYFSLFDLGISRATTKYIAEYLASKDFQSIPKMIWTSIGVQIISGIIGGVVCAILTPFLVNDVFKIPPYLLKDAYLVFYIISASLPFILLSTGLRGVLEASQRFDLINLIKIPSNALIFIIPAALVSLGYRLPEIVLLLIVVRIISAAVYLFFCFKVFDNLKIAFSLEIKILKKLMSFGFWVTITAVLGPLLVYIERFFIASLLSIGMLGFYTVPYEITSRIGIISNSMAITLFPAFSHYSALKSSNLEELFLRAMKYLFILIVPIATFFYIFAGEILNLWLGSVIAEKSTIVFQILIIAFFLNALATIGYVAVQGLGRADLKAKFDIIEVIIFTGLAWVLISTRGINGAALAKLLITFLDIILLLWASHRLINFSLEGIFKYKLIHAVIIAVFFSLIMYILYLFFNITVFLILIFCVVFIYFFIVWQFAMDDRDKIIIKGIKQRWLKLS